MASELEMKVEPKSGTQITDEKDLDPKDLLVVQDGSVRVATSMTPQYDANGELITATGTWTKIEHEKFLEAMDKFPSGPWKSIASHVGTRTVRQTQTHAQKYREKMARRSRGLRNRTNGMQSLTSPSDTTTCSSHSTPRDILLEDATTVHRNPLSCTGGDDRQQSLVAAMMRLSAPMLPTDITRHSRHSDGDLSPCFNQGAVVSTVPYTRGVSTSAPAAPAPSDSCQDFSEPDFEESMDFLMDIYSSDPDKLSLSSLP